MEQILLIVVSLLVAALVTGMSWLLVTQQSRFSAIEAVLRALEAEIMGLKVHSDSQQEWMARIQQATDQNRQERREDIKELKDRMEDLEGAMPRGTPPPPAPRPDC
jgi:hypothetical protein